MRLSLIACTTLVAATPAIAQSAPATGGQVPITPATPIAAPNSNLPDPNDRRDTLTLGIGAAYHPDYEGSNDYRIIPGAVLRARYKGIAINSNGTYIAADLINGGGKVDFDAGPIVGVRLNRNSKVHDALVNRLPRRKVGIELGGFAGVSFKGLTNPYDQLSFKVEAVHDINAHKSTVITPSVSFSTPLSRTFYAGVSASADFVQNRYADYYFGITPAETFLSTLRTHNPCGGFKSWQVGALANQSLSGDLTHGLSLFGLVSYKRLVRDFARSPLVADRSSAKQWFVGAGAGYTW